METANTSHETSNGGSASGKDTKRQQFTNKQRMDMYAFCVLELEMHSNKVSIKKQQQAIQKVLEQQKNNKLKGQPQQQHLALAPPPSESTDQQPSQAIEISQQQYQAQQRQQPPNKEIASTEHMDQLQPQPDRQLPQEQQQSPSQSQNSVIVIQSSSPIQLFCEEEHTLPGQLQPHELDTMNQDQEQQQNEDDSDDILDGVEGKTLLQLQQEVAMTRKCYSDYQRTQVLTSSMLRDVQKRFAKYYPDSAIPSRTTIKHVFEKCVVHGTVENIRTPRKATKIPQGDEIEYLLIHEPQLSLRQMAQKLNVSTGTVSRRCRALGLVPESVTIKHQQLATARRQKQMKQLENKSSKMADTFIN